MACGVVMRQVIRLLMRARQMVLVLMGPGLIEVLEVLTSGLSWVLILVRLLAELAHTSCCTIHLW